MCCSDCGTPRFEAEDPDARFTFTEHVCDVCAGQAGMSRLLDDRDDRWWKSLPHDKSGDPVEPPPTVRRPMDGRHVYLRWLSPDDDTPDD